MALAKPDPGVPAAAGLLRTDGLRSFSPLFDYLFCLLASTVLVRQPLLGGALLMVAQVSDMALRLMRRPYLTALSRPWRVWGLVMTGLSALVSLGLILIYPLGVDLPYLWVLFCVVLLVKGRSLAASRLNRVLVQRGVKPVQRAVRLGELVLVFLAALAALLFLSQPTDTAWYLLGGFTLTSALEGITLYAARPRLMSFEAEAALQERRQLSHVAAYRSFRRMAGIMVIALQVSMLLGYTLIGTTAGDLLLLMGIAFVSTYLPSRLSRRWLILRRGRGRDSANALLGGLALWLAGLVFLGLHIHRQQPVWAFFALALTTAGTAAAMSALESLDASMEDVVRFALNKEPGLGEDSVRTLQTAFSSMMGQMVTLIGLGLLLFFPGAREGNPALIPQPTLLIPAAALVAAALLSAMRFPLVKRHRDKLKAFLMLKENGETNVALQKQLEDVVIQVSRRKLGIKLVILLLRPFFYCKLVGKEQVKLDPDTACVFTCNHSEIFGPVVTNLFIPFTFRPWVISEMAVMEETAEYLYTYTFKRQKWLPESLKRPLSRFVTPPLNWIMASIECIPVYRNRPRDLINTFRDSAAAMEAGDNLLIFPEDPNDPSLKENGYVREGVGPFFKGFVNVAQIYYRRTGKCAQFYPLYADKRRRRLTFGKPIRYNPDNTPVVEQERVSSHLWQEMHRLSQLQDSQGRTA